LPAERPVFADQLDERHVPLGTAADYPPGHPPPKPAPARSPPNPV
jgi:hypothetical protein